MMNQIGKSFSFLTRKKNKDNKSIEYEFLPAHLDVMDKPPAPAVRITAFIISTFLIITLAWSILGNLDIHATAQGKLLVSSNSKTIQPLEHGEVSAIYVRDGQHVRKGDVLIELNTVDVKAEKERLDQQLIHSLLNVARLSALLSDKPEDTFQLPPKASKIQGDRSYTFLKSELTETRAALNQLTANLEVNIARQKANKQELTALNKLKDNVDQRLSARRLLVAKKSLAKVDLLEQEKELLELARTISSLNAQTDVLRAEHKGITEQMDSYIAEKKRTYHELLDQEQINITQIQQEIIKVVERLRRQTLRSPVTGVVQELSVHTLGGVVTPAQELMVIVPVQSEIEAEVNVLNKDIGFVLAGQNVEIKIDSFPFTKYGTINGKVLHVSQDAVEIERLGLVFPARVQLSKTDIIIDDNYVPLVAGMSVVAEIKTGSRRVIEYLLSPLQKYQSEALRER